MIYNDGQLREVLPYVPSDVEWFVIGGPADGNEAQTLVADPRFSKVRCIGFEPNPVMYDRQMKLEFPGLLIPCALWDTCCQKDLVRENRSGTSLQIDRSSSLVKYAENPGRSYRVRCLTLDQLSLEYGPFQKVFLWLDVEGAEMKALRGASALLKSDEVRIVNAEVFSDEVGRMKAFLKRYGLREVHRWNEQVVDYGGYKREWQDIVYVRQ